MDAAPARQLSPARTIRGLTVVWALIGVAWIVVVAFSLAGPAIAFLVAVFAAASFSTLVLLALWWRTRAAWDALKLDDAPAAYITWTVLGAVVFSMLTFEAWSLITVWYLSTHSSPGAPIRVYVLWALTVPAPVLWIVGRGVLLIRRFKPSRGPGKIGAKTR